jgi:hypothetical protein
MKPVNDRCYNQWINSLLSVDCLDDWQFMWLIQTGLKLTHGIAVTDALLVRNVKGLWNVIGI